MSSAATMAETLKHVWTEPKAAVSLNVPNADWWEPRYDQPWRRKMFRDYAAGYLPSQAPIIRPPKWYPSSIFSEIAVYRPFDSYVSEYDMLTSPLYSERYPEEAWRG